MKALKIDDFNISICMYLCKKLFNTINFKTKSGMLG